MTTQNRGRPTGKTGKLTFFDDKELNRVLRVAEDKKHPKRNIDIVMLSNYLCLRSIELAALKISDVLEQNTI